MLMPFRLGKVLKSRIECASSGDGAELSLPSHIAVTSLEPADGGEVGSNGQQPGASAAGGAPDSAAASSIALSSSPNAASVSDVQSLGQVLQQMVCRCAALS